VLAAEAADAAAAEVYAATVRELGGRRNLPAFQEQEIAQPRFAAAQSEDEGEAQADAQNESVSEAEIDSELDAEVGTELEEPPAHFE